MAEYDIDKILSTIIDTNDSSWQPNEKIPLITKEIELIKADTKSYLRSNDFDVASILKEGEELCAESKTLVEELEACKVQIEQETMADILKSIESYEQIAQEIYHTYYSFDIIYDVVQYGRFIREFNEANEKRSYVQAIESVCGLLQLLKSPADGVEKLDIYANTEMMAQTIFDLLSKDLDLEWERMLQYATNPLKDKMLVTIGLPLAESCVTPDVLNALELSKKIGEKVSHFANFLLKEALVPIINNECTVTVRTKSEIVVSISEKYNYQPEFSRVMKNLKIFFSFLNKKLNIEFYQDYNLITIIGSYISAEFCDMLIKDCFVHTIPHNLNDLQDYGDITTQIEEFQDYLIKSNFIKESDNISLLKYMDDLDVLFADRSSEYFLDTARYIMLKDLSNIMSIGVESIPETSEKTEEALDIEPEALEVLEKTIPNSLFYFPRCMISKSAQEILDLVHMVMEQAVQCPDLVCKRLYTTVRLIFELYDAVVPYHHENFLQTIPQYVALFHNNCMYLAHNLLTLGDKWLNLMEEREVDYAIGFVDLVQKMRELGYKHLTIHMQQQRKQILDNIRSSDLNCIDVKDVLDNNAEAAVRQCLRQLQLLKNVWIGVFPHNVFTRLMATLVNMFIDELIHRVCTVEDISIEMATQLTEMYSLVVQKAPGLFQNSTDVQSEVKSWTKLQELIFVLGASLKDIESHWNDGTGPLAKHFHTEELRSLIKALFQNTQFRANLLSKIK